MPIGLQTWAARGQLVPHKHEQPMTDLLGGRHRAAYIVPAVQLSFAPMSAVRRRCQLYEGLGRNRQAGRQGPAPNNSSGRFYGPIMRGRSGRHPQQKNDFLRAECVQVLSFFLTFCHQHLSLGRESMTGHCRQPFHVLIISQGCVAGRGADF